MTICSLLRRKNTLFSCRVFQTGITPSGGKIKLYREVTLSKYNQFVTIKNKWTLRLVNKTPKAPNLGAKLLLETMGRLCSPNSPDLDP
ncbi:hypothetical protein GWI33_015832 [Rhynchophorus ferrugineus]|uniref:Uncharacterized protein n=1 Tax=Rhynchophorus ferrugineus TaxID=354439 RepID=A0A834I229_RHYFE|nr:hypothetical protein GWI33_015832 [Rhynchophorus ferrugineus]